jgi:hypothetical protein
MTGILYMYDRYIVHVWQVYCTCMTGILYMYDRYIVHVWQVYCTCMIGILYMYDRYIVHVWQVYSTCDTYVRFMHLRWHEIFYGVAMQNILRHNVKMLQKPTIFCESFKTWNLWSLQTINYLRNNSWKPECVLCINMGWLPLGIKFTNIHY